MIRNVGEAMGVAGLVNLSTVEKPLFGSKIPAGEEHPLEAHQFGGLQSPRWADLPLLLLDLILVAKGQNLYMVSPDKRQKPLCAGCHFSPINLELIFDEHYWRQPGEGFSQKYLALKTVAVTRIGTDCKTAFEMAYRTVMTPKYIGNSEDILPPFNGQQVQKIVPSRQPCRLRRKGML